MVLESLNRPYRVTISMVIFFSLVPFYIFISAWIRGRTTYSPSLAWDQLIPLQPVWALVYGALYAFLILLPILVVRQPDHIRRTVNAYLLVWLTAYVFFVIYPTSAPRPERLTGEGFAVWGLANLYSSDPPRNCFPSLHVAHSFVSALTCFRVHSGLGIVAMLCAAFVGLSTLFTKQHYILDVVAGMLLALIAYRLFLRQVPREQIPESDRRVAPVMAGATMALAVLGVVGSWIVYRSGLVGY